LLKKPLINNQIRANQVRVIDETGKQLGVFNLEEAIGLAKERNLDLVQITDKVEPPVCKIIEYGKYLYNLEKKEKSSHLKSGSETRCIRLSFNISLHDLETKAYQAEKFLKKGDKVKIEIVLRGREKANLHLVKEKINQFLELLDKLIPIKIEQDLKKGGKGLTMIIIKK